MTEIIEISDSKLERLNRLNLSHRDRSCYFDRLKGEKYSVIAKKHGISKARADQIFKQTEIRIRHTEFKYAGDLLSNRLINVLRSVGYLTYDNHSAYSVDSDAWRCKKFTIDIDRLKADLDSGFLKKNSHGPSSFANFGKKCLKEVREFLDHQK